jgi:ABC-type transporter Mla MlaB component
MLRVTVEERGDQIVFRIEGKLKGPWVIELEKCWRATSGHAIGKTFGVDLDGVDFVDDQGRSLLTEMARSGVELIATESMMLSIVQQIVAAQAGNSMENTSKHASSAKLNSCVEEHKNG